MSFYTPLHPPDAGSHGWDLPVLGAARGGVGGGEQRSRGVAPRDPRHRDPARDVGVQRAHRLRAHHPQARAHLPILLARRHELPLRRHTAYQDRRQSRARRQRRHRPCHLALIRLSR